MTTNEMKWTPGPWGLGPVQRGTRIITYATGTIARVHGSRLSAQDADAALIAAAPDLYAALRDALAAVSRGGGPQFGPKGADAGLPDRIRAALAKAEGR